jgi:hypothetical protein
VYCTTKVHQCSQLALNLTELIADPTQAGATRILYYKGSPISQLAPDLTELVADPTRAGATRVLYYKGSPMFAVGAQPY